jgi:hypothetical protein
MAGGKEDEDNLEARGGIEPPIKIQWVSLYPISF